MDSDLLFRGSDGEKFIHCRRKVKFYSDITVVVDKYSPRTLRVDNVDLPARSIHNNSVVFLTHIEPAVHVFSTSCCTFVLCVVFSQESRRHVGKPCFYLAKVLKGNGHRWEGNSPVGIFVIVSKTLS